MPQRKPTHDRVDRHLEALRKRERFLGGRASRSEANSYDLAERKALIWALDILDTPQTRQKAE